MSEPALSRDKWAFVVVLAAVVFVCAAALCVWLAVVSTMTVSATLDQLETARRRNAELAADVNEARVQVSACRADRALDGMRDVAAALRLHAMPNPVLNPPKTTTTTTTKATK